ncbi:MAG: hypothetical protein CSA33_07070 [Desulfobulbus propionicus]|nr:MAG: hypothetical protein CSA33_07070 [Desulfobulbus propionicus]
MQLLLSIDDTDNAESPGSGQLLEHIVARLCEDGLIHNRSAVSRHQLFIHEQIPYTSHNSGMCCSVDVNDSDQRKITERMIRFLEEESAAGSDPGLCIAVNDDALKTESLIAYGLQAKRAVLTKRAGYSLAAATGLHLSEHGGTGDGVVGALAAVGLKLYGSDGRCRGWQEAGLGETLLRAAELCEKAHVSSLVSEDRSVLAGEEMVLVVEEQLKTVLINHEEVLPVQALQSGSGIPWRTLTKKEIKQF